MGKSLKGKELGKGISQRKDGRYQARFVNRFGKRQVLYGQTMTEITRLLRKAQYEDEKQLNVVDSKITLDEWFDVWLKTCKKNCRNTTKRTYTVQYNRLRSELGWRKLNTLNLVIIQMAFNKLGSDKSRQDCRAVLADILNRAVEADLIVRNPALGVNTKIECKEKNERRVLSNSEITLLRETFRKDGYLYPIMILALNTGMRLGEILGLCWDCVDFAANVIHIRRTLVYLPNHGVGVYEFHSPKTAAGKRDVPMTKEAKTILLKQRMHKNVISSRHPAAAGFEDLVFVSKCNQPIHESNVRTSIRYYTNRINDEHPDLNFKPFTPHSWRHTFATNCIAKGMKPKVLQKILGHTTLQMTMDLYCHVEDETVKDEMALFAEMA